MVCQSLHILVGILREHTQVGKNTAIVLRKRSEDKFEHVIFRACTHECLWNDIFITIKLDLGKKSIFQSVTVENVTNVINKTEKNINSHWNRGILKTNCSIRIHQSIKPTSNCVCNVIWDPSKLHSDKPARVCSWYSISALKLRVSIWWITARIKYLYAIYIYTFQACLVENQQ